MNSGNLRTIPIRVDVFLDKYSSLRKLPAEKRNVEIISNIEFLKILNYALNQDKNAIDKWVNQYKNKLTNFLKNKKDNIKIKDYSVYCNNINYLIDIIVQRIRMVKGNEQVKWEHDIEQISKKVLRKNNWLKCERNFDNYDNRYVYVKKMMYDLCEDIDYIMNNVNILYHRRCSKIIGRLKYRTDTLMQIYKSFIDGNIFSFDNHCTVTYIEDKFKEIKCEPKDEPAKAMPDNKDTMLTQTQTYVQDQQEDAINGDVMAETDAENLESLSFELDLNQYSHTEPKLDTTYAAASLAGISLVGTLLYKYGPSGFWLYPRRGARIRSNVFPLGNNLYDASTMDNFEYLQTGIPNGQYRVGYGSVTH